MGKTATTALLALTLTACTVAPTSSGENPRFASDAPATSPAASQTPASTTPSPTPTVEPLAEFWANVPTDGLVLKEHIDTAAAAGDCVELQATFDLWANADHFRGSGDMLEYIYDAADEIGCYA